MKRQFLLLIIIVLSALVSCRNRITSKQFNNYYTGTVIDKKQADHNIYSLVIRRQTDSTDTLVCALSDEDFDKVGIGDTVIKYHHTFDLFCFKRNCLDTSCAIILHLISLAL
jgi:hypothetical protein